MLWFRFSRNYFNGKLKSVAPTQIRILTIFAKFSTIQHTFLAKLRIKVPRNTPALYLRETDYVPAKISISIKLHQFVVLEVANENA